MKKVVICLLTIISSILFISKVDAAASTKANEDFANIIFFAYFEDSNKTQEQSDYNYLVNNSQRLLDIYDGSSQRSFTNYLKNISYGKFNVKNIFPQVNNGRIEPVKITGINIEKTYSMNCDSQIIDQVLSHYPSVAEKLDYNNDGFIDNVTIIVKSRDGLEAQSESTMVSHKSDYPGTKIYSSKYVGTYNIVGTSSILGSESSSISLGNDAGVIAHEFLHSLGYPDLYRTQNGDDMPVYIWDIMASANHGMPYPLAFLRSEITGWLDIETITTSTTNLRLDLQSNASGNQAYILKSPLNDYEFFVVEYRKKGDFSDMECYDRFIGDSGVIVYRVDTTVPNYSNSFGSTGIYVFRPHDTNNEKNNIQKAALSDASGKKNTLGSSNMSATLTDGALTFSDGSNSGIVIKNVKTNNGYMTLDVEIPNESQFDLWKNTNMPNININSTIYFYMNSIINYQDKIYSINYANTNRLSTSTTIYTRVLNGDSWSTVGTQTLNLNNQAEPKMFVYNNELYFANITNEYPGTLKLYKWNNTNAWTEIKTLATNVTNYFDIAIINNKIYYVTSELPNSSDPITIHSKLYLYENNNVTNLGTYYTGSTGVVKLSNIGNTIYTGVIKGDNTIHIFKYNNSSFTELKQYTSTDNSFDMTSLNNKLYITFGKGSNGKFGLGTYNGTDFSEITTELTLSMASLVVSQGNLYVTGVNKNKLYIFAYNEHNNTFTIEGNSIATGQLSDGASEASFDTSLISIGKTIYVMYKDNQDKTAYVKKKEVTNHLLSITLTPPTKTSYKVGETLSTNGIKVIATYTNGSKEVTAYTIDDFDATEPGTYTAIVSYEGLYKTFTYTIEEQNVTLNSITLTPPTKTTYKIGESLDKTGMKVIANYSNGSKEVTNYTITNFNTTTKGTFIATVTYEGKTATFTYKVEEVPITLNSITLTPPTKTTYKIGESLDKTGMKVIANYSNGSKEVTNYTITNFNTTTKGTFTATVTYEGKTATFTYKVEEIPVTLNSITLTPPTKTTYKIGESLDKTGMKVIANYSNGSKEVTNYTITNFNTITKGTFTATVTYEGKTATFTYTVVENQNIIETLFNMAINRGFKIKKTFIHQFKLSTLISDLKAKFDNKVTIKSNTDIISTGTEFSYNNEKYVAVVYGDINGDGKINSADLLKMRQHLLGTSKLSGAYEEAANLTNDTIINSADLLRLRQHLLGTYTITQ